MRRAAGPPALVLGKHITALGVLRVLSRDGVDTRCVEATSDMSTRSRWYRRAERTLPETTDSEVLAAYLEGLTMTEAVLVACNDRWSASVAGLPDRIKGRFRASISPRPVIEQFTDKALFRRLVERLEIPAPRSIEIASPDDLGRLRPEELSGYFLKPTDTSEHIRRFGTKGTFVSSIAEAAAVVQEGSAGGIRFLLQEWIPGVVSRTILLDGFVDRQHSVKAIVARRRVRMYPPRLGGTVCDVTIELNEVTDAVVTTRRLLEEVGYRGVFSVEYKLDERDGRYKIIELNPRPFWLTSHIANAGADLPWMSYLDAQDLPVPIVSKYAVGRYGHYELPDAYSILMSLVSRHRPEGAIIRPWILGDYTASWPSDPLPGLFDIGHELGIRLRGRLGKRQGATRSRSD